jgi:hypothetical protein
MEAIRIRNLRSLADTGDVQLKPITLLVGANSSGKSSFLRVFPMLKQSAETRTGSGLLLNEPYVDYGVFPVALRKDADPQEIILDFEIELTSRPDVRWGRLSFLLEPLSVRLSVHFAQRSQAELYSYIREVDINLGKGANRDVIILEASEEGRLTSLRINEYEAKNESTQLRLKPGRGIVPLLSAATDEADGENIFVPEDAIETGPFAESLLRQTNTIFHGRTLKDTRLNIFRAIKLGSPSAMLEHMRHVTDNGVWNMRMKAWEPTTRPFIQLRNLLLGDKLAEILSTLSRYVSEFARSVHYFEPIRARVQRDYMSRDVQVENVESDGKNVAMFLTSLSPLARNSFQGWMSKNFGLSVYPEAVGDGSRVALRLREEKTGSEFNLADMGFGYSQMLPLLVQNRLGHLVERKQVGPDDIQVLLFERGRESDPLVSTITKARFNVEGVLENWPFGFFLPDLEDTEEQLPSPEPLLS